MTMTPTQLMLSDLSKKLHEARMVILDNLFEVDPEARDRPLQEHVMKVLTAVGELERENDYLLFGIKPEEDGVLWRKDCVVLDISERLMFVKDDEGTLWDFPSNGKDHHYSNISGIGPMISYPDNSIVPGAKGQIIAYEDGSHGFAPLEENAQGIDRQESGIVTHIDKHHMVVTLNDGCYHFDLINDLGVESRQGSIRKPDGTVVRNAWSYSHILDASTGLHQIVCEDVVGWVVWYTNGEVGFTPRPVSEECNDVDYKGSQIS